MAVTARQLEQVREQRRPEPQQGGKKKPCGKVGDEARVRARTRMWVQGLTALMMVFVMALGLIVVETAITNRGYELAGLRTQLKEARRHADHLEAEVASLRSIQRIVAVAEEDLGLVQASSSYATVASISGNSPVTLNVDEVEQGTAETAGVTTVDAQDSSGSTARRVVLYLESEPASDSGLRLADVGTWLLRWLRGAPPVRASTE